MNDPRPNRNSMTIDEVMILNTLRLAVLRQEQEDLLKAIREWRWTDLHKAYNSLKRRTWSGCSRRG